MIRSLVAATLAALLLSLSGCVTASVTRTIREEGNPTRELAKRPFVTGSFLGEEERDGVFVRVFEFPDALAGDPPRSLRVWVPVRSGGGPCGIEEVAATGPARGDAVLFRSLSWRGDDLPFERGDAAFDESEDSYFVGIGTAFHDKLAGPRGVALVAGTREEFRSEDAWRATCDTVDVAWVRRRRGAWAADHAAYPFAVAVDVVTLPLWGPIALLMYAGV